MKFLVTGATGFIGSRLVPHLQSEGHAVVALSRRGNALPDGQPTRAIDLASEVLPDDWLHGIDVVVHLAGIAHQDASDAAYHLLNVEVTRTLARSAAAAGVRTFIFMSSVKAMGPAQSAHAREEFDCETPATAYAASKLAAEEGLREHFEAGLLQGATPGSAMSILILRPALVYGEGAKGNLPRLAKAVSIGVPCPPAVGSRSMVSLTSLIELVALIAASPPAGLHLWIACDDDSYSTADLFKALRRAKGRSDGAAWLPLWVWRAGAAILDLAAGERPGSTFEKMFGFERYSNQAVKAMTGWRPTGDLLRWVQSRAEHGRAGR